MVSAETPEGIVHRFAGLLEKAGIPYMLTGSFASGFHGSPRATHDIDFVIAPTSATLRQFVDLLAPERYYVSSESALEAYRRQSMFNIVDLASGWKIDLICRKSRPFSLTEFERRSLRDLGGDKIYLTSVEDAILSKLEWSKIGGSERQLEDVAGILKLQRDKMDLAYLERWVEELELGEQWRRAMELAT
jgi:hypothetical protein